MKNEKNALYRRPILPLQGNAKANISIQTVFPQLKVSQETLLN